MDAGAAALGRRSPRLPPSLLPSSSEPRRALGARLGGARSWDPGDGGAPREWLSPRAAVAELGPASTSTQRRGGSRVQGLSPVPVSRFGRAGGRERGSPWLGTGRLCVGGGSLKVSSPPPGCIPLKQACPQAGCWGLCTLLEDRGCRRGWRWLTRAPAALKGHVGSVLPALRPHSLQPEAGV